MLWIKVKNESVEKFPYMIRDLQADNPSVSFPKNLDASLLASFGVYEVVDLDKPEFDERTQKVAQKDPELTPSGWVWGWAVFNKTDLEVAVYDAEIASINTIRRNEELRLSDWTQLPDAPADASVWAAYRQALRDITSHTNWPNLADTDWPIAPE